MPRQTGVYPCYKNQFKIETGVTGTPPATTKTMSTIADMETFGVSFDNGIEEWTPFETEGWVRRLATAKSVTVSVTGKRNVGDAGNDAVSALISLNGREVEKDFEWVFPDGSKVVFASAIVNVTNVGAGDSTGVAPLEFEVMSNGKPTFTPAV